jgi:indole-3-glycerol phosphate synthase
MAADVLQHIIAYKQDEVAALKASDLGALQAKAASASAPRGFAEALRLSPAPAIIAEIKKASPSKGLIRTDFDPSAHAKSYQLGGAACLSVLTDGPGFHGSLDHLVAARTACTLPCLRKDFMIDPLQALESRAHGADAILIIMDAVSDLQAQDLYETATALGMDVLVETHDEPEVHRANALGARLIGVNNRNLRTFETDLKTTESLASLIRPGACLVAESGIANPSDIARLTAVGARAFLVGESLMRQPDPAQALRALRGRLA